MIVLAQSTMPAPDAGLWSQTTSGEIALFIVGVIFTFGLLAAFFWITFRAAREKSPSSTGNENA